MATTSSTVSAIGLRFGRPERTEVRANFARDVLADMKAAYLGDDRPWVVGFSGGKDSTALVQWLYYMLAPLPAKQRRKHVYVLASWPYGSRHCMSRGLAYSDRSVVDYSDQRGCWSPLLWPSRGGEHVDQHRRTRPRQGVPIGVAHWCGARVRDVRLRRSAFPWQAAGTPHVRSGTKGEAEIG